MDWKQVLRLLVLSSALLSAAVIARDGVEATDPARADDRPAAPGQASRGFRVVAVGDIACAPGSTVSEQECHHSQVANLVASLRPRQLWLVGDLQYDRGERTAFDQVFDRSWGRFKRISRPVPGNHEYLTPGASGYFGYFGAQAGDRARGYYSFRAGDWQVLALNSNCTEVPCGEGSRQLDWLRDKLRKSRSRCTAAFWHHPRFSSGPHGGDDSLRPIWRELRRARAELVVSGHDHGFEAFAPQDENGMARKNAPRELVVGTGGRSLYRFDAPARNSAYRVADVFGALELDLRRDRFRWRFVAEDGTVRAAGAARCR